MPSESSRDAAPPRRAARSFRAVVLGAAFLAALIVAVAFALYVRFIRYERIAAYHVPPGSVLAVRLDVQQAILYDPVRRHVLPLLGGPSLDVKRGERNLARLEEITGFTRGDLREFVVARGADRGSWVLVISGLLSRSTGISKIATALGSDGSPWTIADGGQAAVRADSGVAVGRAEDGAVVVASSLAMLRRALPRSDAGPALGLEPRGPGSFVLGHAALAELAREPVVQQLPELAVALDRVQSVTGSILLGDEVGLRVTCTGEAALARRIVDGALEMLGAFGRRGGSDASAVAREMAERARKSAAGDGFETHWEREELDRLFELLGGTIRHRYAGPE